MTPYFIFKGINSKDYKILINEMSPIQVVDNEVEFIEVPGRDGYLTIVKDRKPSITKEITITVYPDTYIEQIKGWLRGAGKLVLSNEPGVYYEARIDNIVEYFGVGRERNAELVFTCQPNPIVGSGL